jgi:tRNA threonylcarbamoyladenosine biosynthesis protein TsaE
VLERSASSANLEETRALGLKLGRLLQRGDFVGLSGELGAGKTALAKAVAEGLGLEPAEVSSPTFAIVQSYPGRVTLHHADLYRLADEAELYATGFFDLLPTGAALVEWIDRVRAAIPSDALLVRLDVVEGDARLVRARATGERSQALLTAWLP